MTIEKDPLLTELEWFPREYVETLKGSGVRTIRGFYLRYLGIEHGYLPLHRTLGIDEGVLDSFMEQKIEPYLYQECKRERERELKEKELAESEAIENLTGLA